MAIAHRVIRYADERLDALLSITGRMDGFVYRCRNDAGSPFRTNQVVTADQFATGRLVRQSGA
jgi:hypothetical protein